MIGLRYSLTQLAKASGDNFWVSKRYVEGEKSWWDKWERISEWYQLHDYDPNYRSAIMPQELILETDLTKEENYKIAVEIARALSIAGYGFKCFFSGGKSYHFHIWFYNVHGLEPAQVVKARKLFVKQLLPEKIAALIDESNLNKKHLILIPGCAHPKTGVEKTLFKEYLPEKLNEMPVEIIKEAKKNPTALGHNVPKLVPTDCPAVDFALNNRLPEGNRHNQVSPNVAAIIRGKPNKEDLLQQYVQVQFNGERPKDLNGWLEKGAEFNCKQLQAFMENVGKSSICDLCLLGDDNNA